MLQNKQIIRTYNFKRCDKQRGKTEICAWLVFCIPNIRLHSRNDDMKPWWKLSNKSTCKAIILAYNVKIKNSWSCKWACVHSAILPYRNNLSNMIKQDKATTFIPFVCHAHSGANIMNMHVAPPTVVERTWRNQLNIHEHSRIQNSSWFSFIFSKSSDSSWNTLTRSVRNSSSSSSFTDWSLRIHYSSKTVSCLLSLWPRRSSTWLHLFQFLMNYFKTPIGTFKIVMT